MNNKVLAMLAYVTIFGWLIAFLVKKEETDSLRRYHLKQGIGLFIVGFILNFVSYVLVVISPSLNFLGGFVGIVVLIFSLIGIFNAYKEEKKPLPIFGEMFEDQFNFL